MEIELVKKNSSIRKVRLLLTSTLPIFLMDRPQKLSKTDQIKEKPQPL